VGSLAVVPGGADDAPLSIRVVMGVDRDPRDCTIAQPQGCIFARRSLRYRPHERTVLPIVLFKQCAGVPCDADSTCNALGVCIPTAVDPASCSDECKLPNNGDLDGGVTPDTDAGDASALDASDATSRADAAESGTDAAAGDGGTGLACMGGILMCPAGTACSGPSNACCEQPQGKSCVQGTSCLSSETRYCCSASDCPTNKTCVGATTTTAGTCVVPGAVSCSGSQLKCPPLSGGMPINCTPGTTSSCCDTASSGPICQPSPICSSGRTRYCCQLSDCGTQGVCLIPAMGTMPGQCTAM
jgi:hypothetical protein